MTLRLIVLLGALLCARDVSARQDYLVRVIDGDTLDLDGRRIRLHGIDAPEKGQVCADGWRAGVHATEGLQQLVRGQSVRCDHVDWDRYGADVSICYAGGTEINASMVSAGNAWAYVKYSKAYAALEIDARVNHRGLHAHDCAPAWDWRRSTKQ